MSALRTLALGVAALAAATVPLAAQVGYTPITPIGQFNQAISISPNGEYVCGGGATNGFIWSEAGGLVTGFGFPAELWGVTDDGGVAAGSFLATTGLEAGVWRSATGTELLGNFGGAAGCPDFSHLFGLSADGTTGVGMSWQSCKTWPLRWTEGVGLSLMAKQNPDVSARASGLSDDGVVSVGWDQGLPGGGTAFNRRACIWLDDATQIFPTTTGSNPQGLGECTSVNSDGSVVCGTTSNQAFRWTPGGGLELLPNVPGFGGQHVANDISEDGSVAVGVRLQFPTSDAVMWTPETGAVRVYDYLVAQGVTGISTGDFRNATGVSADGTRICGWGNSFSWVVDIVPTWKNLGGEVAGTHGAPELNGVGTLAGGTLVRLSLTGALENAPTTLVIGLSELSAPFKGGLMVPNPDVLVFGLTTNGSGNLLLSAMWPVGIPSGFTSYYQHWITDVAGPAGFAASNGLSGTTP
jgi:hypothetical protein